MQCKCKSHSIHVTSHPNLMCNKVYCNFLFNFHYDSMTDMISWFLLHCVYMLQYMVLYVRTLLTFLSQTADHFWYSYVIILYCVWINLVISVPMFNVHVCHSLVWISLLLNVNIPTLSIILHWLLNWNPALSNNGSKILNWLIVTCISQI